MATVSVMATPRQIDSLEVSLTDWIGATNTSTLLQLLGSRPRSLDSKKNPLVSIGLIADLHDSLTEHGDHELADGMLELAGYPPSYWVPSCSGAS